ncbi:MAG TPA: transposase family protein [Myxococcota bacterium]|jgi:hypothetical protein|nr:transposase family protein [Myxococcota bacterium]
MPVLATSVDRVSSAAVDAALLLSAIPRLAALRLPRPTVDEVLRATGSSRSRAYELKGRLRKTLDHLVGAPGRPAKPAPEPAPQRLATQTLRHVFDHPGCVGGPPGRRRYSDGFRRFVVDLLGRDADAGLQEAADALAIPAGTLKDWMAGGARDVEADAGAASPEPDDTDDTDDTGRADDPLGPRLQTVLSEWDRWQGSLTDFCDHLRLHLRIPWGRTLVSGILEAHGVRIRRRRPGRSPDEDALRGAFETFFPHAQWVGDGTVVPVEVDGRLHVLNVEMHVDASSGAFVGADVSPAEDGAAVVAAFEDAVAATGVPPLALLLDNKPSNHAGEVLEAVGETVVIPSTPFRAQNKAHVEGGFGLLKPTVAGLRLSGGSSGQLAASFLRALVVVWARTVNHRPRADRGGRSRAELQLDRPTPDDVERARLALAERLRRQRLARRTLAARQDPVVRAVLQAAFDRLGLDDPQGRLLTAVARFPLEAVVDAIGIFEGKARAGTLPEDVDARYLLGIARNVATERETLQIADALWDARVAAGDLVAKDLRRRRSQLDADVPDPDDRLAACVDRATDSDSRLDRIFWLRAAADIIEGRHPSTHRLLFRRAARRIAATHALPPRQRTDAVRILAQGLRPLS